MYIGIDIGGSFVKIALRDEGRLRMWMKPTALVDDPRGWFERLMGALPGWVRRAFESGRLKGVGIGVPGELQDPGIVIQCPHLPRWRRIPVGPALSRELKVPVYVENDAHMAALGVVGFQKELKIPSVENVFVFTLGSGVGGGWILKGKLYRHPLGGEMEVGHSPVPLGERLCTCGRKGCLEAYAGGASLLRAYREEQGFAPASVRELIALAKKGDPLARQLFSRAGVALGIAAAWITNLLLVQSFVFSGGVSFAQSFFSQELRGAYLRHTFSSQRRKTRFYFPRYRDRLGSLGALYAAEQEGAYRMEVIP